MQGPLLIFFALMVLADARAAAPDSANDSRAGVAVRLGDAQMQTLREDFVALRRDVGIANPGERIPGESEVAVFVSIDPDLAVVLDRAGLATSQRPFAEHRYGDTQLDALRRGGTDRLYVGELPGGAGRFRATFSGHRTDGKLVEFATDVVLAPGTAPRYVELRCSSETEGGKPVIVTRELW